jgi:hypothetical protein
MALRWYFSVRNLMRNDSRMGWERREVRLVSMKETQRRRLTVMSSLYEKSTD